MKIIKLEKPSCNPCTMVSNFLNSQSVDFEAFDVTENPEVGATYGVMSVPVTILLDDQGNEVKRVIGFNPDGLQEIISELN